MLIYLVLFMAAIFMARLMHHRGPTDFKAYYQAAYWLTQGETIYERADGHFTKAGFLYSPAVAMLFAVFIPFGLQAASIAYYIITSAAVIAFLLVSLRFVETVLSGQGRLTQWKIFFALLAIGSVMYRELHIGNVNALLGFLSMAACWSILQKRDHLAGALIGICVLFKPHYGIFLLLFLGLRRWRVLLPFAILLFFGMLIPSAVYGFSGNIEALQGWWKAILFRTGEGSWIAAIYGNNNIFEVLAWPLHLLRFDSAVESVIFPLLVLILLFFAFALLLRKCQTLGLPLETAGLFLFAIAPMLSQQDINHFVLELPVLLFLLAIWPDQGRWWRAVVVIGMLLLGMNIYELWKRELFNLWYNIGVYGIGTALLVLALIFFQGVRTMPKLENVKSL